METGPCNASFVLAAAAAATLLDGRCRRRGAASTGRSASACRRSPRSSAIRPTTRRRAYYAAPAYPAPAYYPPRGVYAPAPRIWPPPPTAAAALRGRLARRRLARRRLARRWPARHRLATGTTQRSTVAAAATTADVARPRRAGAGAAAGSLHRLEALRVQAAHDQLLGSALQVQRDPAALVALGRGDRVGAHDGAAMDLPEAARRRGAAAARAAPCGSGTRASPS